jgi:hypothetical protein
MTLHDRWGPRAFKVRNPEQAFAVTVRDRDRLALETLMAAGALGCTPIVNRAPGWSAYVHLRARGVAIETVKGTHAGQFAGHHARHALRSEVAPAAGRPFRVSENMGAGDD